MRRPAALPNPFHWVTNLSEFYPTDPIAGSFNLTFGTENFGLDVGEVSSPPPPILSKPAWSVFQPFPGADIIRPTDMVPVGGQTTTNT